MGLKAALENFESFRTHKTFPSSFQIFHINIEATFYLLSFSRIAAFLVEISHLNPNMLTPPVPQPGKDELSKAGGVVQRVSCYRKQKQNYTIARLTKGEKVFLPFRQSKARRKSSCETLKGGADRRKHRLTDFKQM